MPRAASSSDTPAARPAPGGAPPRARDARIWFGPSGWSYPDWEGVVYPARKPRGFRPLAYLARFLNAVEVNSSFYRIPTARMTSSWPALVPGAFRFAFKLTRSFTHERVEFPPRRDFDAFLDALRPIREARLLGPVLAQFPWSFRFTRDSADWLARLRDNLHDVDLVTEVRHSTWLVEDGQAALRRAGGVCNIDQPLLRDCIPPSAVSSGPAAYVRLHGRNAASWFAENVPPFERYNYLYTDSELREWVERIRSLRADADDVYVFANNHYRGQSVTNALELRAMIEARRVSAPPDLVSAFPRLANAAPPQSEPGLFDNVGG